MTLPAPSVKGKSGPESQEASNCLPSAYVTPTYFMVSWSPGFAAAPVPWTMSPTTRLHGGGVSGTSICGFFVRSVVPETLSVLGATEAQAAAPPATGPCTAGLDGALLPASDWLLSCRLPLPLSLLPPQADGAAVMAPARSSFLTSWTPAGAGAARRSTA